MVRSRSQMMRPRPHYCPCHTLITSSMFCLSFTILCMYFLTLECIFSPTHAIKTRPFIPWWKTYSKVPPLQIPPSNHFPVKSTCFPLHDSLHVLPHIRLHLFAGPLHHMTNHVQSPLPLPCKTPIPTPPPDPFEVTLTFSMLFFFPFVILCMYFLKSDCIFP